MNQSFKKKDRLGSETAGVIKKGRRIDSQLLRIYLRPGERPRFSAVVGRKTGNSVTRNRLKRWGREVFRREKDSLKNYDIVVIYKKGSAGFTYSRLEKILKDIWTQEKLLKN